MRLQTWIDRVAAPLPGRQRDFVLYWVASFLIYGGWGWTLPLQGLRLLEAGIGLGGIGLIQAASGLASLMAQSYLGHLSDRFARRRPFLLAALGASAPLHVLFVWLHHPVVLAALVVAMTVLQTAYITMLFTSVSSIGRPGQGGRTFAAYRISGSVGWVVTSLSLAWVLGPLGIRGAYALAAGVYGAVTLGIGAWLPEPPVEPHEGSGKSARPASVRALGGSGRMLLRSAELRLFYAGTVLMTFSMAAGAIYIPIYLKVGLGLNDAAFGVLTAVPAMFEVPFMLWLGRAADRWGVHRLLALGAAVGVVRWGAVPFATQALHVLPLQVLNAWSFSSTEILGVAFLSQRVGLGLRGTALGVLSSAQALGRLVAPAAAGALGDRWGLAGIFWLAAAAALLAAPLFGASRAAGEGSPADDRDPHP
ncbi:MAG: MFS transporter [Limnochordaceae bacterium]|nr:MFS transporter [Limnochordaceae bacterium]